jgi:long-chain acyl-CoA synthetase
VIDRPGAAGKPIPACVVKVVDDYDRDVPAGTPGEIIVRGPIVFQGYYDQPEVTAYTLRNGWHHTGDVGRFDEHGSLYYVKRKPEKELIKPGGENVYPAEVEAVLHEHPAVVDAAVVGVPDERWGESGVAFVVTRSEAAPEELRDWCSDRLARYKVPREVRFVEELPRSAMNKVLKDELAGLLQQEPVG